MEKKLRKIIGGKSILTQEMLSESNTIYIVEGEYDLNGAQILVPDNVTLKFQGGAFSNGTLSGSNTTILSEAVKIFADNLTMTGSWKVPIVYPEWFGAIGDGINDDTMSIQKSVNLGADEILFINSTYSITSTINVNHPISIQGNGNELRMNANGMSNIFAITDVNGFKISEIKFNANLKGRGSIAIAKCSNFEISGCVFTGYSKEYAYYKTDSGLMIDSSVDGIVQRNIWTDHGFQYGAVTEDLNRCLTIQSISSRIMVDSNIFDKVNQAIVIDAIDCIISNNTFVDVRDNSLYVLSNVDGLVISGNLFDDRYDESIVMSGKNISITGNVFKNIPSKVLSVTGNLENIVITGNVISYDQNTSSGTIFIPRETTYKIKGLVFSDNSITAVINNTSYDYISFTCEIVDLIFSRNIINVPTVIHQKIIRVAAPIQGRIADNQITGTHAQSLAVETTGAASGMVLFEDNKLTGCRASAHGNVVIKRNYNASISSTTAYLSSINANKILYANTYPKVGDWAVGDIVYNNVPTAGGYIGWVCINATAGSVVWKEFGLIAS